MQFWMPVVPNAPPAVIGGPDVAGSEVLEGVEVTLPLTVEITGAFEMSVANTTLSHLTSGIGSRSTLLEEPGARSDFKSCTHTGRWLLSIKHIAGYRCGVSGRTLEKEAHGRCLQTYSLSLRDIEQSQARYRRARRHLFCQKYSGR